MIAAVYYLPRAQSLPAETPLWMWALVTGCHLVTVGLVLCLILRGRRK